MDDTVDALQITSLCFWRMAKMIKKVSCLFSLMSDSACNYEKCSVYAYIQSVMLLCSEMIDILALNARAKCNLYFVFKVEKNQRLKQGKNSKWCSHNLNTNKRSVRINLFVCLKNSKKAFHELFHMTIKLQLLNKRKLWNLKKAAEN